MLRTSTGWWERWKGWNGSGGGSGASVVSTANSWRRVHYFSFNYDVRNYDLNVGE